MEIFREVISNPMHKTQKPILYCSTLTVQTAADSFSNEAVKGLFSLVPFNYDTASHHQHYTTTKNHTSISLPASNENTG